jgi:hypothetical protein
MGLLLHRWAFENAIDPDLLQRRGVFAWEAPRRRECKRLAGVVAAIDVTCSTRASETSHERHLVGIHP